jgi:hypothetical protein
MELISQRVAAGLQIKPNKPSKGGKKQDPSDDVGISTPAQKHKGSLSQENDSSIDWKKWGDRVAVGKIAVTDIKRLRPGKPVSFLAGFVALELPEIFVVACERSLASSSSHCPWCYRHCPATGECGNTQSVDG